MQIKEAVLQCGTDSEDSLSDDELAGMLQCLPNEEDMKRLSAAPKDVKQLGAAEQFMLAMLSIPQVSLAQILLADLTPIQSPTSSTVLNPNVSLLPPSASKK